jgi:signal transduction histidine kinase
VGRATAYLLGTLFTAVTTAVALPLWCVPAWARSWAGWHQRRAGRLLGVAAPTRPVPARRYLRWLPVHLSTGVAAGLVAVFGVGNALLATAVVPLWWAFPANDPVRLLIEVPVTSWGTALTLGPLQVAVLSGLAYWLFPSLAGAHARATLALLAPSAAEQLADQVAELTRTRADVLEAHSAELRRIERDLHDGTQARLVGIALRLSLAREALTDNPGMADKLLREAHEGTEEAMTELREVIRTVYPPILADRGLAGALATVASRGGVPTRVDIGDLGAIPAAVEAVAYFAVTETLTNVAKHSHATECRICLAREGSRLRISVTDDGLGGAHLAKGHGLAGLADRVQAAGGALVVQSPAGGPTTVLADLPCP